MSAPFLMDAREDLDKVMAAIRKNSLHYTNIFPDSRKKDKIAELEIKMLKRFPEPSQITLHEFVHSMGKNSRSNHIKDRTLHEYRSYLTTLFETVFWRALICRI
jgi:tryptophanase